MAGIINLLLAGRPAQTVLVSVTGNGSGAFGFQNGGFGSITPPGFAVSGFSLQEIDSAGALGTDFAVSVLNTYSGGQNGLFSTIIVFDQSNSIRTFSSTTATFTAVTARWSWGTGSSPVWTAGGVSRNASFI